MAVVAMCLAVADGFRWGNRWYVASQFGEGQLALERLTGAHAALLAGLGWLCLAMAAAAVGWQLRIVRPDAASAAAPER